MAGAGAIFSTASTKCPGRQVRVPLNHAQRSPAAQRLDRSQVYRSSDETRSERVARSDVLRHAVDTTSVIVPGGCAESGQNC